MPVGRAVAPHRHDWPSLRPSIHLGDCQQGAESQLPFHLWSARARREVPYASLPPLGRLTTHLSDEGLAAAVLDGVLIVDPVERPIGETND